jgi:hypothetical protein
MANKKPSRPSTPEIHTNPTILPPADPAVQEAAPTSNCLLAPGLKPGDPLYETARAAQTFAAAAKSAATRRAYKSDWKAFSTWCSTNSLAALPAEPATVALYLTALAGKGRKAATTSRRVISISAAHRNAGYKSLCDRSHPVVMETLQGSSRHARFATRMRFYSRP